jgi:nitrous oxidase accessory protein NosD
VQSSTTSSEKYASQEKVGILNIITKKEALNGVFVHANRRRGMLLYTLPYNSLSDNITAIGEGFRFVRQIGCFVKIYSLQTRIVFMK